MNSTDATTLQAEIAPQAFIPADVIEAVLAEMLRDIAEIVASASSEVLIDRKTQLAMLQSGYDCLRKALILIRNATRTILTAHIHEQIRRDGTINAPTRETLLTWIAKIESDLVAEEQLRGDGE